jgi:hypothetical protein
MEYKIPSPESIYRQAQKSTSAVIEQYDNAYSNVLRAYQEVQSENDRLKTKIENLKNGVQTETSHNYASE